MELKTAMKCAQERSKQYACMTFVLASVRLTEIDGEERAVVPFNEFSISDFYDGSTVATYNRGMRVT